MSACFVFVYKTGVGRVWYCYTFYMEHYQQFYLALDKPSFAPPDWAFGVAWGIIYPLIAIAFIYLIYLLRKKQAPESLMWLFLVNMIGNFAFTPILFRAQNISLATLDIYFILITLALLEWRTWKHSKLLFFLLLPYLLWVAFATVLQTSVLFLN
jgi:benzodiazapine receptor